MQCQSLAQVAAAASGPRARRHRITQLLKLENV